MNSFNNIVFTKDKLHAMCIHRPNVAHTKECLSGHRITKNKKKYTRKIKHKNNYI